MRDLRRDSDWTDNVQTQITKMIKSGDVQQAWQGHQLELALQVYLKSIELAEEHLSKLDVAAQKGSKQPPKRALSWSEGYYKYYDLANYVKELARTAYLAYVEQKLGLCRHGHIVFRRKPVSTKSKARKTK